MCVYVCVCVCVCVCVDYNILSPKFRMYVYVANARAHIMFQCEKMDFVHSA